MLLRVHVVSVVVGVVFSVFLSVWFIGSGVLGPFEPLEGVTPVLPLSSLFHVGTILLAISSG